jgi:CBS domain-containing protein
MSTVQEIIARKAAGVVTIDAGATVLAAARLMNEQHIGALVVTRGDKMVGMFTERDVLNRVVAQQRDPATTAVADVMSAPVAACSPGTSRDECRAVMRNRRIRHLPVVENDRLLGIVSIGDLNEADGAAHEETIRFLYEYMVVPWGGAGPGEGARG